MLLHQFLLTQLASGVTTNERISLIKLEGGDAQARGGGSGGVALEDRRRSLHTREARPPGALHTTPGGPFNTQMPFALFPLDRSVSGRMDRALGEPSGHGPYLPTLARLTALCRGAQKYLAPFAETKAPALPYAPLLLPYAPLLLPYAPLLLPHAPTHPTHPTHPACNPTHPACSPTHPTCNPTHPACSPTHPTCNPMHPACSPTHPS